MGRKSEAKLFEVSLTLEQERVRVSDWDFSKPNPITRTQLGRN